MRPSLQKLCVFLVAAALLVALPWLEMRFLPSEFHDELPPGMLTFLALIFGGAIYFRRRRESRNSRRFRD